MEYTNGNYMEEEPDGCEDGKLEGKREGSGEMTVKQDGNIGMNENLHINNDHNVIGRDSEATSLLHAFKQLHKKRIMDVENSGINEDAKNKEMLHILGQYVSQLEEQNDVLMTTMMELETEAHQRVIQMEKRLKSSAKSTMEAVINLNECDTEMRRLVTERLQIESALDDIQHQVSSLKIENNFLRDQNFNLNHDIQALLHIIQHARSTGHWEMDCVTFCEVTPEQVFGPVQSMSQLYPDSAEYCSELQEADDNKQDLPEGTLQECLSNSSSPPPSLMQINGGFNHLQWSNEEISNKLLEKERAISNLQSQLVRIEHELILKGESYQCHSQELKPVTQQNQYSPCKENGSPVVIGKLHSENIPEVHRPLPKCLSLPNIKDFMHFNNDAQKLCHPVELITSQKKYLSMMEIWYLGQLKCKKVKGEDNEGKWPCKPVQLKFDYGPNFRQVYSEPLLFIYGNSICVYRPCEPLDKELIMLNEDFNNGIPPCQSIDLKIPTEENDLNLRACEWDHVRNPQGFSAFDRSSCMPCQRVLSKNSCSSSDSDETCCSRDLPLKTEIINLNQEEFSSSGNSHVFPRLPHLCEKNYPYEEQKQPCKLYISRSIQAVDHITSYSIGIQADFSKEATNIVKNSLIENGYSVSDVEEINRTFQKIKENVLKTEDKVAAKEILVEQLQNHLQIAMKQGEMKDTALENVDKKLDLSRKENATLKAQITTLQSEAQQLLKNLEDAKVIQDNLQLNVEARKDQIKEFREQEQVLQSQKRSLMIQLDAQGDQLENSRKELQVLKEDIKNYKTQVEQQTVIIKTLQDVVVQSKRALDVVRQTPQFSTQVMPNSNLQLQSKPIHSSKSSIVDI